MRRGSRRKGDENWEEIKEKLRLLLRVFVSFSVGFSSCFSEDVGNDGKINKKWGVCRSCIQFTREENK